MTATFPDAGLSTESRGFGSSFSSKKKGLEPSLVG